MEGLALLFVADGAVLLAGIWRAGRSDIGSESVERYVFGTLDALRPVGILDPIWTKASGEKRQPGG
jgi:hypothetical protein